MRVSILGFLADDEANGCALFETEEPASGAGATELDDMIIVEAGLDAVAAAGANVDMVMTVRQGLASFKLIGKKEKFKRRKWRQGPSGNKCTRETWRK